MFCAGREIANGFQQVLDYQEQVDRFNFQSQINGRDSAMEADTDYMNSVRYGIPTVTGCGIGIDRLAMMMTDSNSIQDVLFFPQMKPEVQEAITTDNDFINQGVPQQWIPMLRKAGIGTIENLKQANINKLFNDLNGLRKKNKLDVPALKLEELKSWIEK